MIIVDMRSYTGYTMTTLPCCQALLKQAIDHVAVIRGCARPLVSATGAAVAGEGRAVARRVERVNWAPGGAGAPR
jgi:hypothetical protein